MFIGTDGQQILIKHESFYVKVNSCNVQLKDNTGKNISVQPVQLDPESRNSVSFKTLRKLI